METIAKIRRDFQVHGKSIRRIARERKVSRNTVRKVLREGRTEFRYVRKKQPLPKLENYREQLRCGLSLCLQVAASCRRTVGSVFAAVVSSR